MTFKMIDAKSSLHTNVYHHKTLNTDENLFDAHSYFMFLMEYWSNDTCFSSLFCMFIINTVNV